MSVAEDLGKLIIMLNPYTKGAADGMDPHTFTAAAPSAGPAGAAPAAPAAGSGSGPGRIWMEIDTKYADDWTFKGQPHSISKAVRIAYRWAKKDDNGNILYWVTDFLLIGFEGSNGGG
jgi:hypothetical protein